MGKSPFVILPLVPFSPLRLPLTGGRNEEINITAPSAKKKKKEKQGKFSVYRSFSFFLFRSPQKVTCQMALKRDREEERISARLHKLSWK